MGRAVEDEMVAFKAGIPPSNRLLVTATAPVLASPLILAVVERGSLDARQVGRWIP